MQHRIVGLLSGKYANFVTEANFVTDATQDCGIYTRTITSIDGCDWFEFVCL
jgi:hypothetical protein